jgi:hypothetical protein
MKRNVQREFRFDASESKTLCTDGSSYRGNREISAVPSGDHLPTGRSEKAVGRTSDMHAAEKSDDLVVPAKRTNKAETSVAESVEERGSAKGNVKQIRLIRTQCRKCGAFVCQTYG